MFSVFKHFHMTMAILSMVLLLIRFLMGMRRPDALNQKALKVLPHAVDGLLIVSIIALIAHIDVTIYPQGFLGEKVLFFVLYILFSVMTVLALRGKVNTKLRIPGFIFATLSWLWLIHVAFSKSAVLLG